MRLEGIRREGVEKPEDIRERGDQRPEGFVRPDGKPVRPGEFPKNRSLSLERVLGVISSYGSITAFFQLWQYWLKKVIKQLNK